MPRRNNERQQIVEMLKRITARPGSTVEASKFLRDARTGNDREVDVVVEELIDDHPFIQSFEVTSRARKVSVEQVEQLVNKHSNLATDRLFIVSWSGFSRAATRIIESTPNVFPIEPVVEQSPQGPVVKSLMMDTASIDAERVVCLVNLPSGEQIRVLMDASHEVFSDRDVLVGPIADTVTSILRDPEVIEFVLCTAHDHPERETATHFTLGKVVRDTPLFLHQHELDEMHQIEAIEITGPIRLDRGPLDLEVRSFDKRRFGHGRSEIAENEVLFVAELDKDEEVTGLSAALYPSAGTRKESDGNP